MTPIALVAAVVLGMGSLSWGYGREGFTSLAFALFIFGLLWIFSLWRRWDWFSSLGMLIAVLFASIGLWFEFESRWMIAGTMLALFAWDLAEFRKRLRYIAVDDDLRGMERRHLARLSFVLFGGLLLLSLGLLVQLKLTFEWAVFLVILVLLGLAQLIGWFRQQ